jgi:hypothetical protein
MIQAMVKYQTQIAKSFLFEIELPTNINKISSCFPCCTYMTANGVPPSSTHLGRGDHWNIPSDASGNPPFGRTAWEGLINTWYQAGKKLLGNSTPAIFATAFKALAAYEQGQIPAIFLEALTFEGNFTDKIIASLNIQPQAPSAGAPAAQPSGLRMARRS